MKQIFESHKSLPLQKKKKKTFIDLSIGGLMVGTHSFCICPFSMSIMQPSHHYLSILLLDNIFFDHYLHQS